MNKVTRVKNSDYTTISNVFLRDKNLSLKAKGLLATVMGLPDEWDFSIIGLCEIIKEGKTAVYSAIDELKQYGYCRVLEQRSEKGTIIGNDYTFLDNPHTENPHTENPHTENPHTDNQPQLITKENNINIECNNNKEKTIDKKKELFEECWIAYKRKGLKKQSYTQWCKLSDTEKENVMPHIKAYVASRELCYQKDFERYLRDKVFDTVVFSGSNVVYDPTKIGKGESAHNVYMPICEGGLSWNEYYHCYMYIGYWDGSFIPDGYTDDNRPNGASVTLNNGRGTIIWDSSTKSWNKV